jgi:hypothetical protein
MHHVPRASIWPTIGRSLAGWGWTTWPRGTAAADPGQAVVSTALRDNSQMREYEGSVCIRFLFLQYAAAA